MSIDVLGYHFKSVPRKGSQWARGRVLIERLYNHRNDGDIFQVSYRGQSVTSGSAQVALLELSTELGLSLDDLLGGQD
jgi:hypothetical protein